MNENNYKKNFIWNLIGLSFYSFVSLVLLIIVKRFNGMDIAGIFTYAFSISTLFYYFSLYFNRVYQVSNYDNNKSFNQFLSCRLITCITSFILVLLFSIISKFDIYKITIIVLLMFFRIIDAISDTFYGYQQEKNSLYRAGISYTIKSLAGIIIFILIDYFTNNLIISITSMVIVNIIILLFYDYKKYKEDYNTLKFDFSNCKLILREAFPIFIFSFLGVYLANVQKYVLTYYVSNDIQTIFGIIIMPATVLSLVGNYLIMPCVAGLKESVSKNNIKVFIKTSTKILAILFIIGILCLILAYFLGIPVLNMIYNIKLDSYRGELLIIIIAAIFNAFVMIMSNLLTILKENKTQLFIFLFISIIATLLSIVDIKKHGINGAVYSYLISYVIMSVLYVVLFIKKLKSKEDRSL